jgi:Glycosyl transferase family 2
VDSPRVSVVMSVFNGQAFLTEAVESILAQTFSHFEFIIIDDGSTDSTPALLAQYAKRDDRVRVFPQKNIGRAESLNRGIGLSGSTYIARMDGDDIALPKRLEEQVHFLERHPDVGLLGGAYEMFGTNGRVLRTVRLPLEDSEIRAAMLRDNPICHPAVMMRKDVVLASGGYRKALLDADDYDLWLRMAERTRLANLDEVVLRYRIHANQVSIRDSMHQVECVFAARAAASLRSRGAPDPLWQVQEVSPGILETLGVSTEEVRQSALDGYVARMDLFTEMDADAALVVKDNLLRLCSSDAKGRSLAARVLFKAAGIHYRRGRFVQALAAMGRAMVTQPAELCRHLKMALTRRINKPSETPQAI